MHELKHYGVQDGDVIQMNDGEEWSEEADGGKY